MGRPGARFGPIHTASQARERRSILRIMRGSPLKRLRKIGADPATCEVVAFPFPPRVVDLPPGWRHWSPSEKIERLLGMSLDRCCEILSWAPTSELDRLRLSMQVQVLSS
jgi:hypothetical protein